MPHPAGSNQGRIRTKPGRTLAPRGQQRTRGTEESSGESQGRFPAKEKTLRVQRGRAFRRGPPAGEEGKAHTVTWKVAKAGFFP